jgi:hypothetical protein
MSGIKESDWKKFKPLRDKALERFDLQTFKEVDEVIHQIDKNTRERYFDLYDVVAKRDKMIEQLFNHFGRSEAITDIASFYDLGLIETEELETFSEETRDEVHKFISFWNRDKDNT